MSKPVDFYWSDDMRRSIQEIKNHSLKSGNEKFGCNHTPLLKVPMHNKPSLLIMLPYLYAEFVDQC
jgi:hypothetical protein